MILPMAVRIYTGVEFLVGARFSFCVVPVKLRLWNLVNVRGIVPARRSSLLVRPFSLNSQAGSLKPDAHPGSSEVLNQLFKGEQAIGIGHLSGLGSWYNPISFTSSTDTGIPCLHGAGP